MGFYSGTTQKILNDLGELRKQLSERHKFVDFGLPQTVPDIDLQWVMGCFEPKSIFYGGAIGVFVYKSDGRVFKFHYNIHRPESKGPHISNRITEIEECVWPDDDTSIPISMTQSTSFGAGAFYGDISTPEATALYTLMRSLQVHCRRQNYCAKLRKLDQKHLAWKEEEHKRHELKLQLIAGAIIKEGDET